MAKKLSSASFKVSVAPTSGSDATTYWLVPSVTQVKRKKDGTHLPGYVSCESRAKSGEDSPVSGIGTIKFVLTYDTGTSAELLYSSRIIITSDMAAISFRLYVGGVRMDERTVLVVDDGHDGEPGNPGDPGTPGKDGTFLKQIFTQADTCPDAPAGSSIPAGWSESPEFGELKILGYTGGYYPNGGYRRSPKNTAHGGSYADKLRFRTSAPNQTITLRVIVSSETYDRAYIGVPDTTVSTVDYYVRMSGEDNRLISQVVPQPGDHYIEILYVKDVSVSKGQDMVKYKVAHSDTVWVSSAQATYDKTSGAWVYGTWSRPSRYLADTPDMEYVFRREESLFSPESDPFVDKFIPLPFGEDENYLGDFISSEAQVMDAIYKNVEDYYRCIQARPANSEVLITNNEYFKHLVPFTDNPLGVTEERPREYMSFRKKENGKWGAFSSPKLHSNYAKGEPGLPGPAGEKGRMPYPAGFWSADIEYTATEDITPIVYYEAGSTYYVMRKTATIIGVNPMEDYRDNPTTSYWIPFEKYKAIFTEILMANFAKLASAVFHGDYMFSQYGKDADGNDTSKYGLFDPTKLGQSDCPFTPNMLLNFLLGKFMGLDVDINGTVTSEKGRIGGFNINSYGLTNDGERDCYITMRKRDLISGSKYSERSASIGNYLPLSSGRRIVSSMMYTGEEYDEHIVLELIATGSTQKHNIFGGYANICIDALGGCNWNMSPGDHWCMPGLLGIIRYTCTFANNRYTHGASVVWGNGIPSSISHSLSSDVDHPVIRFNVDMGHTDYTVFGQPFGVSARYGRWNMGVNVEALDSSGFSISCWYIEAKVMPGRLDVFVCGRPCN